MAAYCNLRPSRVQLISIALCNAEQLVSVLFINE